MRWKLLTSHFKKLTGRQATCKKKKVYYSGKHKLYGYKVEVAVRANGIASALSRHYSGSVSDINIMSRQSLQHAEILKKKEEDYDYEGEFLLRKVS